MKTKYAARIFATAFVAIVLCMIFAVFSLADYGVTSENTVSDLDENKTYTYTQYDFATDAYIGAKVLDSTTVLTTGVWGIKAEGEADYTPLFVYGDDTGKINFDPTDQTTSSNNEYLGGESETYSAGKWTYSGLFTDSTKVYSNGTTSASIYAYMMFQDIFGARASGEAWTDKSGALANSGIQDSKIFYGFENIKTVSPESTVSVNGEAYKFSFVSSSIDTENLVHYYNLEVSFDGESRHDTDYENMKALAGEKYVTAIFFESTNALPFEEAELYVYLGTEYDGMTVELKNYNQRVDRLRNVESAQVENGWAKFTNFDSSYVILLAE